MKAHIPAASRVSAAIVQAAKGIAMEQADDIAARTANEIAVAMYGCDVPIEKIFEVMNYYNDAVCPKWVGYRNDGLGDDAMKQYCEEHNLPYMIEVLRCEMMI